jgi:hypothetical protein
VPSGYETPRQPLIKKMFFGASAPNKQTSARRGSARTAPSGIVKITMRPRPFAVLDHARLLSADVGLISLPEAYGGCYDD